MHPIVKELKKAMDSNDGKIPFSFIEEQADKAKKTFARLTPNTRVCVLTLETGHEVVGVAQVLDSKNDVEDIGNKIALDRAKNELWASFGAIAKVL